MSVSSIARATRILAGVILALSPVTPVAASHLVTGNGLGFAVVSPEKGVVTKFYPHPHSYTKADPAQPLGEGIETANFIKTLGWGKPGGAGVADYIDDSHVIRLRAGDSSGYFFMPFGLARPALVIALHATPRRTTAWRVGWNRPVTSQKLLRVAGTQARLLRFDGIDESLLLVPLARMRPETDRVDEVLAASPAWALIAIEKDSEAENVVRDTMRWSAGLGPQALVKREIAAFEQWRTKPTILFRNDTERHLWRQSETMLRIAQSREPNRSGRYGNGLIVAALPDVYATPWVRDMAWATVALTRMGHRAEARAALLAYFNARPTGKMRRDVNGADYQVSVVRYFGNGAEEPFFTQEGSTNIEYDNWGEVLWVLGEYLRKYDDPALLEARTYRGPLYASARDFIVKPLIANMEEYGDGLIVAADTSIWEERQKDKKHFAFSTGMAIVGLREFAQVAQRVGDRAGQDRALAVLRLLDKGFAAAFIRDGKLRGTLEEGVKNDIDGALIPLINLGVVNNPDLIRNTVRRMNELKAVSGGYLRVRSTYTDPAIFEYWYERQEFLFVDLNLAETYRRLGREAEAQAMLDRITEKAAADDNIIPEMYVAVPCQLFPGKIGDATGALPMVGYGAGAYVLHLLDRQQLAPGAPQEVSRP